MSWLKRDGDRLLTEAGEPAQLFIVEQFGFSHFLNGEMKKFINAVADNGGNGIRVFGFFPMGKGREEEPYVRRPAGGFDSNLKINDKYFNYLEEWMKDAQSRGIVVLYELFDSVGLKIPKIARYHPFGQFTHGDLLAFSNPDDNLLGYQKRYLEYVVKTLREYPNVIFGIMNEFHKDANRDWHYTMSREVKRLAPDHLTAGSEEDSSAMDDPNVDIWAIHTGSHKFMAGACEHEIRDDIEKLRREIGGEKIVAYSTDGFGLDGIPCEKPAPMRDLAQKVKDEGVQIFQFLDHKAYVGMDNDGKEYPVGTWYNDDYEHVYETARVDKTSESEGCNTKTYRAIAEVYLEKKIEGVVRKYRVVERDHIQTSTPLFPDFVQDDGARVTVSPTISGGFLSYGPYETGIPAKPLEVYFGIFIDNNTDDDLPIVALDVYDSFQQKLLAQEVITRRRFPRAGEFSLFKLSFRPIAQSVLEFRIYFYGYAQVTLKADYIAVVEPEKLQLHTYQDLEKLFKWQDQNIIIRDSLRNGHSEGLVSEHKEFTAEGVQMKGNEWYIKYEIPTTSRGFIEFSARGFIENEGKAEGLEEYKGLLVTMWDDRPDHSPFVFQLRRYGYIKDRPDATDAFKFKITTPSHPEAAESGYYSPPWDPNKSYRFRLEWGGGNTRILRDGQELLTGTYHGEFTPSTHSVQIGANSLFRKKTTHDLLISDVVIGKL